MSETIESTALALLGERALVPAEVFKPGGVRIILDQIKASVAGEKIDVSTPSGREHCRSLAFKIARSKTALDGMGKTLSDEWRKRAEAIHAERRLIEKELDALRDQVRAPLTAYEEREKKRVAAHEEALLTLQTLVVFDSDCTTDQIDERLVQASTLVTTRAWEEFQQRASELFAAVNDALNDLRAQVVNRDKERAEAARLQAEREEQARLQAVREQMAREERLKAEAAQRARQQAEEAAAAQLARAAREAEHDRQAAAQRYQAELEAQDRRAQAAIAAEQQRVQTEERARAKAELDRRIEAERAEAEARAKQRAIEAADHAREGERQRQAEAQRAAELAAKQREANVAHQRKVNREARDAIEKIVARGMDAAMSESEKPVETAQAVVAAIAKGEVPHCKISY